MTSFLRWLAFLLAVAGALNGCVYPENSVAGDRDIYGSNAGSKGSAKFKEVNRIIRGRCVRCHRTFSSYDETDWVDAGYVRPRDPAGSSLYSRLKGANVGGLENMPINDNGLSTVELETIRFWISDVVDTSHAGGTGGTGPTEEQLAARRTAALNVIAARCTPCHTTTRVAVSPRYVGQTVPAFATFTHKSQFLAGGLIIAKLPAASWLYDALQVYGSIATEPKNSPALTTDEKNALRAWISGLP